ncbi:DUF397 domain-containing protein [Nocardiopsis protaetiae]|uniref:DUF397 domain-containing protein n=1 Tax=Nocardiopsis protaetiae TaxID=3382270 RepID=UPI00387AC503
MLAEQGLNFRKSSYSAGTDNCVEVAEVPFHKSSYSNGGGGQCVEVAEGSTGAAVRDSKHPDLGHLSFASGEWTTLLHTLGTA